ncbi:MAG: chemotaxis protein methyltransferase CheR [Paraglaciecola sp.]
MLNKEIGEQEYLLFSQFLERRCGIVLGDKKQYLVRSRLGPLVSRFGFASLSELTSTAAKNYNTALSNAVVEAMTTNETLWFRDGYPFDVLKKTLLANYTKKRDPLRIWSAACSSGQEAYSIAMTILDYQKQNRYAFSSGVQIVGTDISHDMLKRCQDAEYDSLSISRGLPDTHKHVYFEATDGNCLKLKANVRRLVSFKPINLLDSYYGMGKFDIIFCRNVLIYFSADVKKRILQKIAACLQDDGVLFLGASESITGLCTDFKMVRCSAGLYYTKKN